MSKKTMCKGDSLHDLHQEKLAERILGILTDENLSINSEEKAPPAKKKYKFTVHHNTILLLKKYRDLKWVVEQDLADQVDLPPDNIDAIIEKLKDGIEIHDNKILERRVQEIIKTKRLLSILEGAVMSLKYHHSHGKEKYDVIYYTYLCMDREVIAMTSGELFLKCNLAQATYYRIKREAINNLSSILWQTSGAAYRLFIELWDIIEDIGR